MMSKVREFHPFYADVMDLGFDMYLMQQFMSVDKRLELYLMTYERTYTPESGGYFPTANTYIQGEYKKEVIPSEFIVHLAFIGVEENTKNKGKGSELLANVCALADKYDFEVDLDIDTKFGTPYEVLRKWYERFGFHYLYDGKMIRFRKTQREDSAMFVLPSPYRSVLEYVCALYDGAFNDLGYEENIRNDFKGAEERVRRLGDESSLSYMECCLLYHDIEGVEGISIVEIDHPLYRDCLNWFEQKDVAFKR